MIGFRVGMFFKDLCLGLRSNPLHFGDNTDYDRDPYPIYSHCGGYFQSLTDYWLVVYAYSWTADSWRSHCNPGDDPAVLHRVVYSTNPRIPKSALYYIREGWYFTYQ